MVLFPGGRMDKNRALLEWTGANWGPVEVPEDPLQTKQIDDMQLTDLCEVLISWQKASRRDVRHDLQNISKPP